MISSSSSSSTTASRSKFTHSTALWFLFLSTCSFLSNNSFVDALERLRPSIATATRRNWGLSSSSSFSSSSKRMVAGNDWNDELLLSLRLKSASSTSLHYRHVMESLRGGALTDDDSDADEESDDDDEYDSESEEEEENDDEYDSESEEEEESDDEYDSESEEESEYESESEEETMPSTSIAKSLQKKSSRASSSSSSSPSKSLSQEYDEPLALAPMQEMGITLGMMILCNRLDLSNTKIIKMARFAFIGYIILAQAFVIYVRIQAKNINDRSPITINNPLSGLLQSQMGGNGGGSGMVKNIASSFLSSETTVMEYDLQQAKSLNNSLLMPMVMLYFLHFKMNQVQPLFFQTSTGLKDLIFNPLFQIYILGRNLERPFKSKMSKFEEMQKQMQAQQSNNVEEGDDEEEEDEDDAAADANDDESDVEEEEDEEEDETDDDEEEEEVEDDDSEDEYDSDDEYESEDED